MSTTERFYGLLALVVTDFFLQPHRETEAGQFPSWKMGSGCWDLPSHSCPGADSADTAELEMQLGRAGKGRVRTAFRPTLIYWPQILMLVSCSGKTELKADYCPPVGRLALCRQVWKAYNLLLQAPENTVRRFLWPSLWTAAVFCKQSFSSFLKREALLFKLVAGQPQRYFCVANQIFLVQEVLAWGRCGRGQEKHL